MKKVISLMLALLMCLSLCACGGGNAETSQESPKSETQESKKPAGGRESMTEEEMKEKAVSATVLEAVRDLKRNGYDAEFDLAATKYKIGKVEKVEDYTYEVNGTLVLYDKYGSAKETATFTCPAMWINENGIAVGMGGIRVRVNH